MTSQPAASFSLVFANNNANNGRRIGKKMNLFVYDY